jgi:hypothetical protein
MTKQAAMRDGAEKLATKALRDTLCQHIDDAAIKAVADKIYRALPQQVRQAA